jgi:Carboxypeptidase regulatory-like domain
MRLGSRLRWTWGPALWVCALLSSAVAVNGQMNSGQITGIVKDPSGAVVPGATIVAEEAGGGHKFQSVTDPSGEFLLSQLPLGAYAVAAEYSGFKRSLQNGIALHIGQTIRLQFVLELGDIGQQVVVTESATLLKTTSAEISDIVEQRQVTELPLNGRQFLGCGDRLCSKYRISVREPSVRIVRQCSMPSPLTSAGFSVPRIRDKFKWL